MKIDIETLKRTRGIGEKTLERITEQHKIDNDIKSFESVYVPSDNYKVDKDINLWQGDCLQLMSHIPDKSVDMILCDLPYGTTACSWDEVIPFESLWKHYKRIIKDNGAIVLFGSEPFSTKLRMSNLDWYKYDWKWDKINGGNALIAKIQPMQIYEDVLVFGEGKIKYNPQMTIRDKRDIRVSGKSISGVNSISNHKQLEGVRSSEYMYPTNKLVFGRMNGELNSKHRVHPTQKPVKLLEYLIKTYTDEGMLVLDNTMGSGSTGVACKNLNRKFIGIELDEEYFKIAEKRINE